MAVSCHGCLLLVVRCYLCGTHYGHPIVLVSDSLLLSIKRLNDAATDSGHCSTVEAKLKHEGRLEIPLDREAKVQAQEQNKNEFGTQWL